MGGEIKLVNKNDTMAGEKAFVLNVRANTVWESIESPDPISLDSKMLRSINVKRSKILIFED